VELKKVMVLVVMVLVVMVLVLLMGWSIKAR
jgi:hypothetical protein